MWWCGPSIWMLKQRIHFIWNLFMFEVFVWKSLRLNRRIQTGLKTQTKKKKKNGVESNDMLKFVKKRAILRVKKWSQCNNKFDTINKSTYSSSFDSENPKSTARKTGKLKANTARTIIIIIGPSYNKLQTEGEKLRAFQ